MTQSKTNSILEYYYKDNAKMLRHLILKILQGYGGISQKDYDDFFSIGNLTFTECLRNYDGRSSFHHFLKVCLSNQIKDEITKRNAFKRTTDKMAISLSTELSEEKGESIVLGEVIASPYSIENELIESYRVKDTAKSLSDTTYLVKYQFNNDLLQDVYGLLPLKEKEILILLYHGYHMNEITKILNINEAHYYFHLKRIKNTRKKLFKTHEKEGYTTMENLTAPITHTESKHEKFSIHSVIDGLEHFEISFDNPVQRSEGQWDSCMKGNLISDILQNNPIPELTFADQFIDGTKVTWVIDGKQRCSNVYDFIHNRYRISKKVDRPLISYVTQEKDSNGNVLFNEKHLPITKQCTFDIRGRKFDQLPRELQKSFVDYSFEVTRYLDCNNDDIAYHIVRYNRTRAMNTAQKAIGYLGTEFARMVDDIVDMDFFQSHGHYKISDYRNGNMRRIVVESIMCINFIEDWNKNIQIICAYLKGHANTADFSSFKDLVERLTENITEETEILFDSKDSFLWFALFDRFLDTGKADSSFISFLSEFIHSLHEKKIDGYSFDEIVANSGTKDKTAIIHKLKHLETLMMEYLSIL